MLSLRARLQAEPRDFWRLVAEAWGLPDTRRGLDALLAALLDADRVYALWQTLPGEAQAALAALQRQGGTMLWAVFLRRYGPLRDLSPAQWAVEQPHLHPQSPAEWLWYRALVGRAFFATPQGLLEHAYIPADLALLLPIGSGSAAEAASAPTWGRPADEALYAHPQPARPLHTLQVWTRALAWVRAGRSWEHLPLPRPWQVASHWLRGLWQALGLLNPRGQVQGEAARAWLTAPWSQAWWQAYRAWRDAPQVNDLRALTHLRFEGPWQNDPPAARARLLDWLRALPPQTWWDLASFVAAVQEQEPHFQRPSPTDFHSWHIRRAADGAVLRGLAHWDEVDGALVRFWVVGPAHWLGLVDVARAEATGPVTAFRLTAAAAALLANRAPTSDADHEPASARWMGLGRVQVPWRAPREVHYHIARLAEPEPVTAEGLPYRLSAHSLTSARAQGLRGHQVGRWLAAHVEAWPSAATRAVERVFRGAPPAQVQAIWLLRVPEPQALNALRAAAAGAYLVEVLTPTVAVIRAEGQEAVLTALWQAGYLAEVRPLGAAQGPSSDSKA